MDARIVAALLVAAWAGGAAAADYQSSPPRRIAHDGDWGPLVNRWRAQQIPSLMQDFGERYLYAAADAALPPPAPGDRRVVFLGDSITDRWNLQRFFPGKPFVNRGIGAQVTAQMILRFRQDVIALRPAAVIILAGVNDVQGAFQQETAEQIEANFTTMADLADRNGIRPIFSSILPVNDYTPNARTVLADRKPDELRAINGWLREFCRMRHYVYADYYADLVDANGLMRRDLTDDGIHPLDRGYARMAPVAAAAITRALDAPGPSAPPS